MSKIVKKADKNFKFKLDQAFSKSRNSKLNISDQVASIISQVVERKDSALIELTAKFDRNKLKVDEIKYSETEINYLINQVTSTEKDALRVAAERITKFHEKQLPEDNFWIDDDGIKLGWLWRPINRVGLYVPGGTASYPSSVLMNAIPAGIAGVKELVMVTPSGFDSTINPLVILAAKISGIEDIYKIGGAQAIAALAFGTESIPAVDKIVGPGNAFVAEAKRQVFGKVGIDMIAGPSEILIIADKNNDPSWVAADLLSQAEHDRSSQAVLITTCSNLAGEVEKEIKKILLKIERREIAEESWNQNGLIFVVDELDEACAISNLFAPEHLQICTDDPERLIEKINNAGSIFLGRWTPEALGDYVTGTNHVLPTNRSARFSSGLSVLDFMKRLLISKSNRESTGKIGLPGMVIAQSESLDAHELSLSLRLKETTDSENAK